MKNWKHLFFAGLIALIAFLIPRYDLASDITMWIIIVLVLAFMAFNIAVRRHRVFRPYFESKWNIFTSKFRSQKVYDIPRELMLEKVVEVITDSKFKVVDVNRDDAVIVALAPLSFWSWGENIYIDMDDKENKTLMKFNSVTLFGMLSWGKNERNYVDLLSNIEKSLII